jgi:putative tricarboxylic transport membrane protein
MRHLIRQTLYLRRRLLLAVFSLILLARSLRSREQLGFGAIQWRALLVVLGTVLAYLLFLETLGFVTVTFVFLLLLFCFGKTAWINSGAWSAIATVLIYALFRFWFQVQLPRGVLGL